MLCILLHIDIMSDVFADRKSSAREQEISYDKKQLRRSPFCSSPGPQYMENFGAKKNLKALDMGTRQEFSRAPIKGERQIVSGSDKKRVPNSLSGGGCEDGDWQKLRNL